MPNFIQAPIIDERYWDGAGFGVKLSRHFKPGDVFFMNGNKFDRVSESPIFGYDDDKSEIGISTSDDSTYTKISLTIICMQTMISTWPWKRMLS